MKKATIGFPTKKASGRNFWKIIIVVHKNKTGYKKTYFIWRIS